MMALRQSGNLEMPDGDKLDLHNLQKSGYAAAKTTVRNAKAARVFAMQAPAIPDNESDRLAALRELLILDTPPEQRLDKIVHFASVEFNVPIALISLIDSNRQWFKARVGLDACETSREISFCGHAILQPDILVIPDALADERFADNPLVTDGPKIRFYAGAPLVVPSGFAIGTLCLIDTQPRTLDLVEMTILSSLRDLLVEELGRPAEASDA